jgi:5-methylcytosine-specific restriction endonuclease McrA
MKRKRKARASYRLRVLRDRAYHAQGGLCYWCKRPMKLRAEQGDPEQATADHLDPKYAGGKTWPGNIVAACGKCNSERNSPETNHSKASDPQVHTYGQEVHHSPFEVLRGMFK